LEPTGFLPVEQWAWYITTVGKHLLGNGDRW